MESSSWRAVTPQPGNGPQQNAGRSTPCSATPSYHVYRHLHCYALPTSTGIPRRTGPNSMGAHSRLCGILFISELVSCVTCSDPARFGRGHLSEFTPATALPFSGAGPFANMKVEAGYAIWLPLGVLLFPSHLVVASKVSVLRTSDVMTPSMPERSLPLTLSNSLTRVNLLP